MRTFVPRRWAPIAAAVVLLSTLGAAGVLSAGPASAGGNPVVRATPKMHLTDLDTISVRGGNFPAGDVVEAIQCERGATLPIECDPATTSVPVTVNAKGHIPPFSFTVITGPVGTTTCGTSTSDANGCEIAANDLTSATPFVASTNIFFKRKSSLPVPAPVGDRRR